MTGVLISGEKERETTGKRPYEDTVKKKKAKWPYASQGKKSQKKLNLHLNLRLSSLQNYEKINLLLTIPCGIVL